MELRHRGQYLRNEQAVGAGWHSHDQGRTWGEGLMNYKKIHQDPNGHKLFIGDDGMLYIADGSGPTPDTTNDGALALVKPDVVELRASYGYCVAHLSVIRDGEAVGTVNLSGGCAIEAALYWGVRVRLHDRYLPGCGVYLDLDPRDGG